MNHYGNQGAGCCCHHQCPYCSGYAAGFRDGQAAARGWWNGPNWWVRPSYTWEAQQQSQTNIGMLDQLRSRGISLCDMQNQAQSQTGQYNSLLGQQAQMGSGNLGGQ